MPRGMKRSWVFETPERLQLGKRTLKKAPEVGDVIEFEWRSGHKEPWEVTDVDPEQMRVTCDVHIERTVLQ